MKRATITPEALIAKGYKAFEFNDWTLERACEHIRNGCECGLKPQYTGAMVGFIILRSGVHTYEYDVFSRKMTPDELERYKDWMAEEKAKADKAHAKIDARNRAKMRRR